MSSSVEKIKERLDIVQVVGSYLKLEKAGSSLKAACPFHHEKTPSFFISPARGTYYCFGCGEKGDIFSFVERFEGLDFMGALKLLAQRAGVELEKENPEVRSEREKLFAVMEEATKFFQAGLKKEPKAQEYLTKRGLKESTIQEWRLGYVPDVWRSLYDHLLKKGFKAEEMTKAGLVKKSDKAEAGFYDVFRSRIMFPIYDTSGRVIAFSGRIFGNDEETAKYLNSPETPLFNKSRVLYGYDRAKNTIRERDYSILVEGQMDLLMCHQAGFINTAASSGTALGADHLELLRRLSNNLMMAYDGDGAGFRASGRAVKIALSLGMNVKVAHLPEGFDPADLIAREPARWAEVLKNGKHIIDFYLDTLLLKKPNPRDLGRQVQESVLPFVKALKSSIEQSQFVKNISEKCGIREDALWDELQKISLESDAVRPNNSASSSAKNKQTRMYVIERKLLGIIYWQEEKNDKAGQELREKIEKVVGKAELARIEQELSVLKQEMLFEADVSYTGAEKMPAEVEELLRNLEEEHLKEKLNRKMQELAVAERTKDDEKMKDLLQECHELSKRLNSLRRPN
jgi:DNA primase